MMTKTKIRYYFISASNICMYRGKYFTRRHFVGVDRSVFIKNRKKR